MNQFAQRHGVADHPCAKGLDLCQCLLTARPSQDLMRMVEAAGALHVSLNPVTAAAVRKRLLAVAAAERIAIGAADAERIAEGCNGDLRSALETLHVLCCGKSMKAAATAGKVSHDPCSSTSPGNNTEAQEPAVYRLRLCNHLLHRARKVVL